MVKKFTVLSNTSPVPGRLITYPVRRGDSKHGIELAESVALYEALPFQSEPQMIGAVHVHGVETPIAAYLYEDRTIIAYELLNNGENLLVGDELGRIIPRNVGEQISAQASRMSLFGQLLVRGRQVFLDGFLCEGLESHMADLGFSEDTIANHHQHQMDSKGASFNPCAILPTLLTDHNRSE